MEGLRVPFFIAALVLCGLVVLLDLGSLGVLKGVRPAAQDLQALTAGDPELRDAMASADPQELAALSDRRPPGLAIPSMALVDGVLFFTVGLMGVGLLLRERLQGRIQGVITLIFSLLLILAAVLTLLAAFALVILMLSLLLAVPFGTIAYLALFGFFNRSGAAVALGLLMTFKLGFAICLVLAQQRFLQNRGLVLMILTSFLANVIVSFLHGLVPIVLVSITDGIGAIVLSILALIWGVILLIGAVLAVVKAIV
jgi:hypothetical protein